MATDAYGFQHDLDGVTFVTHAPTQAEYGQIWLVPPDGAKLGLDVVKLLKAAPALREALSWIARYSSDDEFAADERRKAHEATGGNVSALEAWLEQARAALSSVEG